MNYNRFLQNSVRTDLHGYNISSCYCTDERNKNPQNPFEYLWGKVGFGMLGRFVAGHQTPIDNAVTPEISKDGKPIKFTPYRHQHTPAFQKTEYRCEPDCAIYENSGLISVKEEKCILSSCDCLISKLTFLNEGREPCELKLKINTAAQNGVISTTEKIGGLGEEMSLKLYCATFINDSLADKTSLILPPNSSVSVLYGAAFVKSSFEAAQNLARELMQKYESDRSAGFGEPKFILDNERRFNEWFKENVPELYIENDDIKKIYYYRWYLVYRNLHTPSQVIENHKIKNRCFYESPLGSWFGCPIGLPVPFHAQETKWMKTADALYEDLQNWCDGIGTYQVYVQFTPFAIWRAHRQHPNKAFLEKNFDSIAAFAKKKLENGALPVTSGSWLTGAEYQPSFYQHTEPSWDWKNDREGMREGYEENRLYRLDEISYSMLNAYGVYKIAAELGKTAQSEEFYAIFTRLREHILKNHYDAGRRRFFDIDVKTGKRCDKALSYDCFAPFMYKLIEGEQFADSLFECITSESVLRTKYGISSVEKSCPMYWFDNCIAGPTNSSVKEPHPYGCCWNGPVWPYANSIVLEAAGTLIGDDENRKAAWLELFNTYTELHFLSGDRSVPVITEHYRGNDGVTFSPYYEYFHSLWLDLFYSHYLGIKIEDDGSITCRPNTAEDFLLGDVVIRSKHYQISQTNGQVQIKEMGEK